nr:M20/M25/M40 family metallo-hydrolase [Kocuria atrinae]
MLDAAELATHPAAGAVTVDYSNTPVVVGTYEPSAPADGARSLILNGHVDVVPEGREDTWTTSPWDGRIEDGWMYGRGAGDMKAGLVANLFAFKALRAAGLEPTGRVHLQSVPEEECTGNGTVAAMQRGYTAYAVLISEPIAETLVRANLGLIWFDVDVTGTAAHAHEMSKGFNALDAAYSLIGDLRELEERWNQITVGDRTSGTWNTPSTSMSAYCRRASGRHRCPTAVRSRCECRSRRRWAPLRRGKKLKNASSVPVARTLWSPAARCP